MNPIIICKSVHKGNTKKIAEAVAEVLDCEVKEPNEVDDIENYDLVGFASGIYFASFHRDIRDFVEDNKVEDVDTFLLSTSGMPSLPVVHNFEGNMKKKLEDSGFDVIGSFNCRGADDYGPLKFFGGIHRNRPNEKDLKEAKKFAEELKEDVG